MTSPFSEARSIARPVPEAVSTPLASTVMSLPAVVPKWRTSMVPAEMFPRVIAPVSRWGLPPPSNRLIETLPLPASISAPALMVITVGSGWVWKAVKKLLPARLMLPPAERSVPSSRTERPALNVIDPPPINPRLVPSPVTVMLFPASANRRLLVPLVPSLPMIPPLEVMKTRSSAAVKKAFSAIRLPPRTITWETVLLSPLLNGAVRAFRPKVLTPPDSTSIEKRPARSKPEPKLSAITSICVALICGVPFSTSSSRLTPPTVLPLKSKTVVKIGLPIGSTPI